MLQTVSEYHESPTIDNPNLAAALKLAGVDMPVFPVSQDRKPLVKWKSEATSDEAQVRRWWMRWPDAMPAMPTGSKSGVSVLDIDVKGGKDGYAALRDLGLDPVEVSRVRVKTPSGGEHVYFRHHDGLTNSVSAIGPGLDVRGEGGYVHAVGAVCDAGVYEVRGDHVADDLIGLSKWPDALRLKRDRKADKPSHSPRGGHALTTVRDALFSIPPDSDYDIWFQCLAAIHHETAGSPRGLALAEAWSASGEKWKRGEVRAKWKSFDRSEGDRVGAGTLFRHAEASGWDRRKHERDRIVAKFPVLEDEPAKSRLRFLSPDDCAAAPSRGYVWKDMLAPGDIGCVFGAPGAGKSLLAPLVAFHVARGDTCFGSRTKAGRVFYVAAEDPTGLRGRFTALKEKVGNADDARLVEGVSNLLVPDGPDLKALCEAVAKQRPQLVILDTLAMAFPGLEENSAEGMGRVVAVARALADRGAAVLLVHHDTKAEGGTPRGHSALNGALDMALHVAKGDDGIVRGKLTKNRNGSCDRDIAFRIGTVSLGTDEDGDEVMAPYAEPLGAGITRVGPRLSGTQKAFAALFKRLAKDGAIEREALVNAAIEDPAISASGNPKSRRDTATRALRDLARMGVVSADAHWVRDASTAVEKFEDLGGDE